MVKQEIAKRGTTFFVIYIALFLLVHLGMLTHNLYSKDGVVVALEEQRIANLNVQDDVNELLKSLNSRNSEALEALESGRPIALETLEPESVIAVKPLEGGQVVAMEELPDSDVVLVQALGNGGLLAVEEVEKIYPVRIKELLPTGINRIPRFPQEDFATRLKESIILKDSNDSNPIGVIVNKNSNDKLKKILELDEKMLGLKAEYASIAQKKRDARQFKFPFFEYKLTKTQVLTLYPIFAYVGILLSWIFRNEFIEQEQGELWLKNGKKLMNPPFWTYPLPFRWFKSGVSHNVALNTFGITFPLFII